MKIIFAGTSEFGIPSLEALKAQHELVLIITQPDRPAGRNKVLTPPPVKVWAEKNTIPVLQPEKILDMENELRKYRADVMLVAAYGQIIPKNILEIPKLGSINIHGSILPAYRGASPIQSAIVEGEQKTGVSFIKMDEKMDHGPVLTTVITPIEKNENFPALYKRLAILAASRVSGLLQDYFDGNVVLQPQDETRATYTKLLDKKDARIRWTSSAMEIHQMVLGLNPEPGTWTTLDDKNVKILETEPLMDNKIELAGKIYRAGDDMAVKCADYSIKVKLIQPEGKKPMPGVDYLNGLQNRETKIFV